MAIATHCESPVKRDSVDEARTSRHDDYRDLKKQIADLQSDLQRVEDRIQRLLKQKSAIVEAIATKEAAISPITCLPPEILRSIFLFACNPWDLSEASEAYAGKPDEFIPPSINIIGVCKFWRDIAMSTSHLWTRIAMNAMSGKCGKQWDISTRLSFKTSGTKPLDVVLFSRDTRSDYDKTTWMRRSTNITDVLQNDSTRIRHFTWVSSGSTENVQVFKQLQSILNLTLLEHLVLKFTCTDAESASHDPPCIIIDLAWFPRLMTFAYYAGHIVKIKSANQCPNLREVTIEAGLIFQDLRQFLRQCPSDTLEQCTIIAWFSFVSLSQLPPLVSKSFDKLTKFSLSLDNLSTMGWDIWYQNVSLLLEDLRFPQLRNLAFGLDGMDRETESQLQPSSETSIYRSIRSLLYRSKAPLESLQIEYRGPRDSELLSCLSLLPQLQTLRITSGELTDDSIHALTKPSRTVAKSGMHMQGLCPELTEFSLKNCGNFTPSSVVELILSRLRDTADYKPTFDTEKTTKLRVSLEGISSYQDRAQAQVSKVAILNHPEIRSFRDTILDLQIH